jgi:hypothetical protein
MCRDPDRAAIAPRRRFGDAVLEIDGELRVWENIKREGRRAWYEQRFLPTLEALTKLDVERVLVTHGEPVLHDGARELAASLVKPPWDGTDRRTRGDEGGRHSGQVRATAFAVREHTPT